MSDGGLARRFAVPPSKIACGFYHTVVITNTQWAEDRIKAKKQDALEGAKGDDEKEEHVNAEEMPVELYSWGGNEHLQLGHAMQATRNAKNPRDPDALVPKKLVADQLKDYGEPYQVSCGARHTMFLLKKENEPGGQLFAAGLGLRGRLGMNNPKFAGDTEIEDAWSTEDGPIGPIRVKQPLTKLSLQVLRVDCGADHTLLFCTDGRLYAFGANKSGQCGVDDFKDVKGQVRRVILPSDKPIHHFAAGAEHSLAAIGDDELMSWGCGKNGRLGLGIEQNVATPEKVLLETQCLFVACGEAHSAMIDHLGKVWAWGAGSYGRLGSGEESDQQVPRWIDAFEEMTDPQGQIKIVQIALGAFHSLFLEEPEAVQGRLFSCGSGHAVGLLAEGDNSSITEPRHIPDSSLGGKGAIKQIAAGTYHNYVLLENGELVRWGSGANGRLAHFDSRVKSITSPENMKTFHGFANKPAISAVHLQPDKILNFTHASERQPRKKKQDEAKNAKAETAAIDVQSVACGSLHTMALIAGGHMYLWGSNSSGQLGLGSGHAEEVVPRPRKLPIPDRRVKEIAAGYEHCLVVTFHAECWSWGKGTLGQLGTGRARDATTPALVSSLQQVLTVSAGEEHSAAICLIPGGTGAKQLYTFGSAENGMLGLGEGFMSGPQSEPVKVEFEDLDAGDMGTKRGRAKAKGKAKAKAKAKGEIKIYPQKVNCGLGHTAVIVGRYDDPKRHNEEENKLFTFGAGWFGRLGLGETSNVYSPKEVKFGQEFCTQDVKCGGYHTVALNDEGELFVWGRKEMVLDGSDDLLSPMKFTQIEGNPELKAVVCGELHTLVVTVTGAVYAWGQNRAGQLGVGHHEDVQVPERLEYLPGNCLMLATGSAHSVAVVQTGDMHAWGNQTCGRLGLDGLLKDHPDKYITAPTKVFAEWASIQSMTSQAAEKRQTARTLDDMFPDDAPKEEQQDESHGGKNTSKKAQSSQEQQEKMLKVLGRQKVTSFATMQMLIKQEKEGSRPHKLKQLEEELKEKFKNAIVDIEKIPGQEEELRKIEGDFQQSLDSNLRYFPKVSHPEIGLGKVSTRFVDCLPTFETLLWLLRLQVMYLVELSACVRTNENNRNVFYRVVKQLYSDTGPRTAGLNVMLLRQMINKEIDNAQNLKVDRSFDRERSRAFYLFSEFSLSQRYWTSLLHKYMKVSKDGDGVPTLLRSLKDAADRGEFFTISSKDYRDVLVDTDQVGGKDRDADSEYTFHLQAFQDYMTDEFLQSVTAVELPQDIRVLLNYFYSDIETRQPGKAGSEDVPDEQLYAVPLLYFFCHGILIPMLTCPEKYASKEVLLPDSASAIDGYVRSNMKRTAMFLEKMVDESWDEREYRVVSQQSTEVKVALLKYLQAQQDIVNDLEARVLVDTYKAHYDRKSVHVKMGVADCMELANMLKLYDSRLRLNQADEMAELVRVLPKWTPEDIEHHKEHDRQYNFEMKTRFFFTDMPNVGICPGSQILMPSRLCCTGGTAGFFNVYDAGGGDDPRKALEVLFGELDPLKAQSFAEMKTEFQEQRTTFRSTATPQYELMQRLQDGLRIVEELENGQAYPEDVLQFMSNSLISRDKHFKYLNMIERGLKEMESDTKKSYWRFLAHAKQEVEAALDMSRALAIPKRIVEVAGINRNQLKFVALQDQLNKRAFKPDNAKDLNLAYTPIKEFSFSQLVKKGVLDKNIAPPYDDDKMKQSMRVVLQSEPSGAVKVIFNIVKKKNVTGLKTLVISEAALQEMKNVPDGGTAELKNEGEQKAFLLCYASEFTKLVQQLGKDTV